MYFQQNMFSAILRTAKINIWAAQNLMMLTYMHVLRVVRQVGVQLIFWKLQGLKKILEAQKVHNIFIGNQKN